MFIERLLEAIKSGEILRVRYFGGSTPGAERQLLPVSVADGTLRAVCLPTHETKNFKIDKIEEVIEGVPSTMVVSVASAPAIFPSIDEFVTHYGETFRAAGWLVQKEGEGVSLHRIRKNGTPLKTPDVDLMFEAMTSDAVFDGERVVEMNVRPRERPWTLRGKGKTTKTFSDVRKAQLAFLEFSTQLSPRPGA